MKKSIAVIAMDFSIGMPTPMSISNIFCRGSHWLSEK